MTDYIGALDQGTTSTRFAVVDRAGRVVAFDQGEHGQSYPSPGRVEHDAEEIWRRTVDVVDGGLAAAGISVADLAAVGITNQRETTVAWDGAGKPLAPAIVWQDTRTQALVTELSADEGPDRFRSATGLPLATYFSGPKMRWLLDHVAGLDSLARSGDARFGTIDSWLAWNLTGVHVTDVTNASRTLLMGLDSLAWNAALLDAFGIPELALPEIRASSSIFGECGPPLGGVPLAAMMGDQQAALFGQACFEPGESKNTYGTGCFLLLNTGTEAIPSRRGMLTTVAFQGANGPASYALEGSVAIAGAAVQWLRDNLGLIAASGDIEGLAASVDDNGDVYFVPAFAGLFAPEWDSTARGVIVGLSGHSTRGHIARAVLEATAFQSRDVIEAMAEDAGTSSRLRVDGGMTANDLLMQFQADQLGIPVVRPAVRETTALGAAFAAGLAVGFWSGLDEVRSLWVEEKRWEPSGSRSEHDQLYDRWKQAVERSKGWVS